ncbi:MAG: nitrate reductase cytochrome c-type subunit [Planctomycetes bacterium]|nr:nitrate reductase cytochrome c-type subunit [Planctomycetota bacterium]
MNSAQPPNFSAHRFLHLVCAVAIGAAGIGYVVGLRQPIRIERHTSLVEAAATAHDAIPATHYAAITEAPDWPNRAFATRVAKLPAPTASPDAPPVADVAQRGPAVDARASRRAYAGAPPTIPHAVDARSAAACMSCHGDGFVLGSVRAPKIPHAAYANCTQCHVESSTSALGPVAPIASSFAGLASPGSGERAWNGAPPTIPHATWMRSDCLSCHGAGGAVGLRSTHPWRQNCLQCHASSWQLERRASTDASPSFWSDVAGDPP